MKGCRKEGGVSRGEGGGAMNEEKREGHDLGRW